MRNKIWHPMVLPQKGDQRLRRVRCLDGRSIQEANDGEQTHEVQWIVQGQGGVVGENVIRAEKRQGSLRFERINRTR